RIQGVVIVSVTVGPDGHVITAQTTSGHPLLIQAAVDAVKQWTFEPPMVNGKPVTAITSVPVNFKISDPGQDSARAMPQQQNPNPGPPPIDLRSIDEVMPVYPKLDVQARIQSIVTVLVGVAPDGQVTSVKLLSGHPLLQQASIDAIKQW